MARLLAILLIILGALTAAGLECTQCGKAISGRYLTAKGKNYCSNACHEKTLPKCALCSRHFREGMQITEDPGKVYCKECAAKPHCFNCRLPSHCRKLDDGRDICENCFLDAVFEVGKGKAVFEQVRRRLRQDMQLDTGNNIHFMLTSLPDLEKLSQNEGTPGQELGLYSYTFTEVTTTIKRYPWSKPMDSIQRTNERFAVYVLYGMTVPRLIEVCAHELAHDWMQKNYPKIRDPKIREGFAEYVAHSINRLYGHDYLNLRIEKNPDPVYGGGYRMIADYVAENGFNGLLAYFEELISISTKNTGVQ